MRYIILFFLLITFSANAQKLERLSYHITPKEGLPDKGIYKIITDAKGFVWIASGSGLYKYDGDEFVKYEHPSHGGGVFGIKFDHRGRLWFNTLNDKFFYIENDKVILFKDDSKTSPEILRRFSLFGDDLYIVQPNRILKINTVTKEETSYKINSIRFSVFEFQDELYVANEKQLLKFPEMIGDDMSKYLNFSAVNPVRLVLDDMVLYFVMNKNGKYFFKAHTKNQTVSLNSFDAIKDFRIFTLNKVEDKLWVLTSNGIYVYSHQGFKFTLEEVIFKGKQITSVAKDLQGNYWVSTYSSGIFVMPEVKLHEIKRLIKDRYITSFEAISDDCIAYFEEKRDLVVFNSKTSKSVKKEFKRLNQLLYFDKQADKLHVFVGIELYLYDDYKNLKNPDKFRIIAPKDFVRISDNQYIGANYNRSSSFDAATYKLDVIKQKRCWRVDFNPKDSIAYFGYAKGLEVGKDIENTQRVDFDNSYVGARQISIRPNSPKTYVIDKSNKIIEFTSGKITADYSFDGFKKINAIEATEDKLWIGIDKGLFRYAYNNKTLEKIEEISGFQVKKLQATDNYLWLVSDNKIVRVPKNYKKYTYPKAVPYFKSVKINGQEVVNNKAIKLHKQSENINLSVMINGFRRLKSYRFEYKVGTSKWLPIEGNQLTLSSLPYGLQQLTVRGIHKITGSETKQTSIYIKVVKPFYLKWWFFVINGLLVLLLVYFLVKKIVRYQNNKRKKVYEELKVKQQLTSLKLENLRSQMNPHFIFNSLNSIQEYIYNNKKDYATSYLVKFSRLMRIYLEHSRTSQITLKEEIQALKIYLELENNRFDGAMNYNITVSKDIDVDNIMVPTLFIQPYVENAIKHGLLNKKGDKELNVTFHLIEKEGLLLVSIKDNGIGREASTALKSTKYHRSFATKANLDRVKLMNSERKENKIKVEIIDLKDYADKATGTEVVILIPLE